MKRICIFAISAALILNFPNPKKIPYFLMSSSIFLRKKHSSASLGLSTVSFACVIERGSRVCKSVLVFMRSRVLFSMYVYPFYAVSVSNIFIVPLAGNTETGRYSVTLSSTKSDFKIVCSVGMHSIITNSFDLLLHHFCYL